MQGKYTKEQITEAIAFWQRRLDEAQRPSAPKSKRNKKAVVESKAWAAEALNKVVDAIEGGCGLDEVKAILQQAGWLEDPSAPEPDAEPLQYKEPRKKNASGQWYMVYSSDTASDDFSTAYGPFPTAYDANLYWWKEYGRDVIGAPEGIDDFDDECAADDADPDDQRDTGWIDNGAEGSLDWSRYRYEVVSNKQIPWFKKNRKLTFAKPE